MSDAFRRELGERIRARRQYLSFTQADLAGALGVERSLISNWERGEREIASSYIPVLARMLKVTPSYLFGEQADDDFLDAEAAAFYNNIPPDLRPAAREVLKALAKQARDEETTHGRKAETDDDR